MNSSRPSHSFLYLDTPRQAICDTSDNPALFLEYFDYLNRIESHEAPDYDRLIELFASQLTNKELEDQNLGILDSDMEPDKVDLEATLKDQIINARFRIGDFLRSEFAVFVHNGEHHETCSI